MHRYSNRWLGREPRGRRPGARGPDIRRGAAAALDGATRAAGGPAGTVPRPAPRWSSLSPSPALLAPRPGRGGARRGTSRAELRAPTGSQPVPLPLPERRHLCLRRPPEKFVVRSRMAPFICGSGTGKGLAVVMAPPPAATAPRGRLAQCTPPPPPAWAPSSGPAAGNQGRPARVRALVGCRRERGSGEGEREGQKGPTEGIARRVGGRAQKQSLGRWRVRMGLGALGWASESPSGG